MPYGHPRRRRDLRLSPISAMARIREGHTDPLASSEARPSGLADTQHPSGIAPEAIIKRLMVTVPPIEGNADCRARYHLERLMTPREFFYPRVAMDFYQSMTTQAPRVPPPFISALTAPGYPSARHIVDAPPYSILARGSSTFQIVVPYISARHGSHSIERDIWRFIPSTISKGFYFGPHHLIMAALRYFEEKVHRKKLQRADMIPLLFPRLLCHILEHMSYPTEPHLERSHQLSRAFHSRPMDTVGR
ncbi:hypothetical protein CK203_059643 [Vitis vinifera]|uniref:Uncharacterized protein n=1 Tax=Vitis vinifera TaxID=29760 RepID=A0A438H0R7_VITVI|nr:hypothetical protein CK203_059643 [Vitis vinifera]